MPLKLSYRNDGGVVITASGTVTGRDLLDAGETIYATEAGVKKTAYVLTDFTAASRLEVNAEEVRRIAQQDLAAAKLNPSIRAVVVSPDNLAYGLSRMWAVYAENATTESKVFRDRATAETWLRDQLKDG